MLTEKKRVEELWGEYSITIVANCTYLTFDSFSLATVVDLP